MVVAGLAVSIVVVSVGYLAARRCVAPRPWPAQTFVPPVIGWKRLRLLAVIADDTTVLLACRRHPAANVGSSGGDRTIVLRLGVGEDAWRAQAMLEQWCREGAWLRVGLAPVTGSLELADQRRQAALWAPLAAA
jgi:hypothetical protein